jgi:hypothetical protein
VKRSYRGSPTPAGSPPELLQQILDAAAAMTATGQEPHRHHLVPRFYLERWAAGNRVQVTDLVEGKRSYPIAPIKALVERDYYRVPAEAVRGGSPVVWETWLSKIEGEAAEIFAVIDAKGLRGLDQPQWARLLYFLGVQVTRSRSYRFQGRWMMGPGYYQMWELYRPGAIGAMLGRAGEDPTPERIAQVEAYFAKVNKDPWSVPIAAELEMDMAIRGAAVLAEILWTRQLVLYRTAKPLLTSDEPVVLLYEHMGVDHPNDGGYSRAPIIVFPFGPREVLAMFRQNMPVQRPDNAKLDWSETLELNRVIAGNAHRNLVEGPDGRLGAKLYIPDFKDPARFVTMPPANGDGPELLWIPSQRRWHSERDAPVRPVASWWPAVVPPAPREPATATE